MLPKDISGSGAPYLPKGPYSGMTGAVSPCAMWINTPAPVEAAVRRTEKAEQLTAALDARREDAYSRLRGRVENTSSAALPTYRTAEETENRRAAEFALTALAQEASDLHAAPERLARIAAEVRRLAPRRETNRVYEALASHPNTPPDLLAFLMPLCPAALAANPILPLLLLEVPDFTARLSRRDRFDLLRQGDLPVAVARLLCADPDSEIAEAARFHIAVGGEIPNHETFRTEIDTYLHERAARPEEAELLQTLPNSLSPLSLDHRPPTTDHLSHQFARLAAATLAGSPYLAPTKGDGLRPLFGVARYRILASPAVAQVRLPDSTVSDADFLVRLAIAVNPLLNRRADLLRLSRDGNRFVRFAARLRL